MDPSLPSRSRHFELHPLAEGVFAAIAQNGGAADCNAGLMDLGGHLVVFDTFLTPQAARDLRAFAEEVLGRPPGIVINSHYHNDHIWGNQVFLPEAHIASSRRTRELITTEGMQELRWYSETSAQRLQEVQSQYELSGDEEQRRELTLWIGHYGGVLEALPHLSVTLPDITFDRTLALHGSRHAAELVTFERTHTESDSILVLADAGIVFMSDVLFVGCHPYLAEGDPQQLLAALRQAEAGGASVFVPGHGPLGTVDDLRLLREYIEHCLDTARRLVDEGTADEAHVAGLAVPREYSRWQVPQFYQKNVRAYCQRAQAARSGEHGPVE